MLVSLVVVGVVDVDTLDVADDVVVGNEVVVVPVVVVTTNGVGDDVVDPVGKLVVIVGVVLDCV